MWKKNKICPVEASGGLDTKFRKTFQDPKKILKPYIKEGMTVLDYGCGPGFFTLEIAKLLNGRGKVLGVDLQQGMLDKLKKKIDKVGFRDVVSLHRCLENSLNIDMKFDFILMFYMFHELPEHDNILKELKTLLNKNGKLLIVEPKVHVSKKSFSETEGKFIDAGFKIIDRPSVFFSKSMLFSLRD